jgi:predicted nucleotidyltransferase
MPYNDFMQLDERQTRKIEMLARKYGIRLILLFGSTVTGRLHSKSDTDAAILLEKARALSFEDYSALIYGLETALRVRELDLSLIHHADPLFLKRITDRCQILYGSQQTLSELKIYAFKRFQDHKRFFDLEAAYVKRTLSAAEPVR